MKFSYLIPLLIAAGLLPFNVTMADNVKRVNMHLNFGQDILLLANKTVSMRAQCVENEPPSFQDVLRVYGTTTAATGTVTVGVDNFNGTLGDFLTPNTSPLNAELMKINNFISGDTRWFTSNSLGGYILDTNPANNNKPAGLMFNSLSAVVGVNPDGCFLSVGIEKINEF